MPTNSPGTRGVAGSTLSGLMRPMFFSQFEYANNDSGSYTGQISCGHGQEDETIFGWIVDVGIGC